MALVHTLIIQLETQGEIEKLNVKDVGLVQRPAGFVTNSVGLIQRLVEFVKYLARPIE